MVSSSRESVVIEKIRAHAQTPAVDVCFFFIAFDFVFAFDFGVAFDFAVAVAMALATAPLMRLQSVWTSLCWRSALFRAWATDRSSLMSIALRRFASSHWYTYDAKPSESVPDGNGPAGARHISAADNAMSNVCTRLSCRDGLLANRATED